MLRITVNYSPPLLIILFLESVAMSFVNDTFWEVLVIGLPATLVPIYLIKTLSIAR
jgi:hypothetical protein